MNDQTLLMGWLLFIKLAPVVIVSTAALVVTTGANLMKNSQTQRRVWLFNYLNSNWILYTLNLVYFITVMLYLVRISIINYDINYLTIVCFSLELSCVIVSAIVFLVTSIPVKTILNTYHFITCYVYLYIGIDSYCL